MLDLLEKFHAPEWVLREFVYWKYTAIVCLLWFIGTFVKSHAHLDHPAYGYVFAVLLVWVMIEMVITQTSAKERWLIRDKTIRIYMTDKIKSISSARLQSDE